MATNLYSGLDFTTGWTANLVTNTTGQSDAAGGSTAAKVTPDTTPSAPHNLAQNIVPNNNRAHTARFKAKASGYTGMFLRMDDGTNSCYVVWDVSTGIYKDQATGGTGFSVITHFEDLSQGNGFARYTIAFRNNAAGVIRTQVIPGLDSAGTMLSVFTGNGTSGIIIDDPELYEGLFLDALAGSYTYTGTAAGLLVGRVVAGGAGAYTLTGTAANLVKGSLVGAASGSYALTGTAATLTYTPLPGAYTLTADSGGFTETGTAATLKAGRTLPAAFAQFTLTGQAATLTRTTLQSYTLTAASGAYLLVGGEVIFIGRAWTPVPIAPEAWAPVAVTPEIWTPV